jgi:outer membrane protein assembly factor BamB
MVYASADDDYPTTYQTTVSAYDASNGKTVWSKQFAGTNSIEVWVVNKVVLLNMSAVPNASGRPTARNLLALSTSNGEQLWTQPKIEIMFVQDNVIYAANDPNYRAINSKSGQLIWQQQYP